MIDQTLSAPYTTLGIARCASAGAFATLILFVLGWGWAMLGLHGDAFLGLFTSQPAGTTAALAVGGLCAFAVGGLYGALIAHCYNLAGRIFRLR